MKCWEQQDSEPDIWFLRFRQYLLLGSSRSLGAAYRADCISSGKEPAAALPGAWGRRSREFDWEGRAAEWDKANSSNDEDNWRRRRQELREKEWEASELLFQKAVQALKELEVSGRFQNIANGLKIASDLGRKSAELWGDDINSAIALLLKFDYEIIDKNKKYDEE